MSGQNTAAVQPPAQYLNVSSIQAEATGGRLETSFVLNLTGSLAAQVQILRPSRTRNAEDLVNPVLLRG